MNDLLFTLADIMLRVIGDDMNRINNAMPLREELGLAIKAARARAEVLNLDPAKPKPVIGVCACLMPVSSYGLSMCAICGGALRDPAMSFDLPGVTRMTGEEIDRALSKAVWGRDTSGKIEIYRDSENNT